MFVAVIVGNLLAVLFAFCGIVNVCSYIVGDKAASAASFAFGLAVSSWPLAVAGMIYLLVQIACLLEKLCLQRTDAAYAAVAPAKCASSEPDKAKKPKAPAEASAQFFKAEPLPPPPPPVTPLPAPANPPTSNSDTKSLIPTPAAPEPPRQKKPADSLNFFRVD